MPAGPFLTDRRRPTVAFFVLTFALSWTLMTPAKAVGLDSLAAVPFFLGVWAPAASAAIVVRVTGGSIKAWLRDILRWRVPLRYYAFAVGFPIALAGVASAEFALAGETLDFGLIGERAAAFLPLLVFCFVINGGPEEPGWRGFALPLLEERHSPVKATLILGTIWGLWHLPLLLVEDNVGVSTLRALGAGLALALGYVLAIRPRIAALRRHGRRGSGPVSRQRTDSGRSSRRHDGGVDRRAADRGLAMARTAGL